MKTILYILVAVLIVGMVAPPLINKTRKSNIVTVQSADGKLSDAMLAQSVTIISNRLKSYSPEKFEISSIPEKQQIRVVLSDKWDGKMAEKLLVQKGAIEFYETYNYAGFREMLTDERAFLSLFDGKSPRDMDSQLGCVPVNKIDAVTEKLNALGLSKSCQFAWSNFFGNADACLFALKVDPCHGACLKGSDIESYAFDQDNSTGVYSLNLQFKLSAVSLWADLTKRNINNSVAFTLDKSVLYCPLVREEIPGGKCTVTGNFTEQDMRYIVAIGSHGELPVPFKTVQ
jgi:preprotein translocase subunit SecD